MSSQNPMYHTIDRHPRPSRERTRFEANRHPDRTDARAERTSLERGDAGARKRPATDRDTAGECR
ncbi:hypothetical protein JMJ58_01620 [Haloterrigena salifodinae]|uniref:Uncharacterized protein n=1 Tax=Haloterrigena salifodinae TaxID=2675099 RepID=A0A8T8E2M5_9EURY|nr:hypothetical protein [Haloterrigena salifodinae]QRV15631.1 hypothetical protein JMJ58_01620 [Haloterrigena salifodinae]